MSIFSAVRGWLINMFTKKQIEEKLRIKSAQSQLLTDSIQKWANIYNDNPPWKKSESYVTLNLWALVCKRLATRVCINLQCDTNDTRINLAIGEVLSEITERVEAGAAKGGLIIKPIPQRDGTFKADFVTAEDYIITGVTSNSDIYGVMFISRKKSGDVYFTKFEIHNREINTGKYTIQNRVFRSQTIGELDKEISLTDVDEWANLQPVVEAVGVNVPLFGYFKPATNNNVDGSPIGIAFPHRATQLCREADDQYNRFIYENRASKKKTIVPKPWLESARDGRKIDIEADLSDVYMGLGLNPSDKPYEFNPAIRNKDFLEALNEHERQIENVLDLSRGTLSRAEFSVRTKAEIDSTDDVGRTTISSNQQSLRKCVKQYCDAVSFYLGISAYEFNWKADEGVVEDEEKKFARWLMLADSNYIPKYKVVMLEMGLGEDAAKKLIGEAQQEMAGATGGIPVDETEE